MSRFALPPLQVLLAPDKFKGTLDAPTAATALQEGLASVWPHTQFSTVPLADGGEGFSAALVAAGGGSLQYLDTVDARGRPLRASWARLANGWAALDLASASGLVQLGPSERAPELASTWGSGLMLRQIFERGHRRVLLGLGGSATNDGGIGIAAALGYRFLDARGTPVPLTGAGLLQVAAVEPPAARIDGELIIATDVDNPLLGPTGAARQFAPQKGAGPQQVETLEQALSHFADVIERATGQRLRDRPGAGAAGGVGFGLMAMFAAKRESGFDVIHSAFGLSQRITASDLVITGEGAFDGTSLLGKATRRLADQCRELGRPVWGVFGQTEARLADGCFDRWTTLPAISAEALSALNRAAHAERVRHAARDLAQSAH